MVDLKVCDGFRNSLPVLTSWTIGQLGVLTCLFGWLKFERQICLPSVDHCSLKICKNKVLLVCSSGLEHLLDALNVNGEVNFWDVKFFCRSLICRDSYK